MAFSLLFLFNVVWAEDEPVPAVASTNGAPSYGLFGWLDRRSMYTQDVFPEPFLIDDMAYEDNEIELTWLHTRAPGQQTDIAGAEYKTGIGLLTLQLQVPYDWLSDSDDSARGVGSIQMEARYPLYQYVSSDRYIDSTFGLSMEGDLPVRRAISPNAELDPQIFNDLKLGNYSTVQTVLGYSTLLGTGEQGGVQSFEYGVSLAYAITRHDFHIPGVDQLIPMLELSGETGLNKEEAGQNNLEGDAGFRVLFNPVGECRPGFGAAFVFPVDGGARQELHWGFILSTTFEF